MAKSHRVVFSFDEGSFEKLQLMTEQGRFGSMAETVRDSLQVARALQMQAQSGYSEVVVRNPDNQRERVLIIPSLENVSKSTTGSER